MTIDPNALCPLGSTYYYKDFRNATLNEFSVYGINTDKFLYGTDSSGIVVSFQSGYSSGTLQLFNDNVFFDGTEDYDFECTIIGLHYFSRVGFFSKNGAVIPQTLGYCAVTNSLELSFEVSAAGQGISIPTQFQPSLLKVTKRGTTVRSYVNGALKITATLTGNYLTELTKSVINPGITFQGPSTAGFISVVVKDIRFIGQGLSNSCLGNIIADFSGTPTSGWLA